MYTKTVEIPTRTFSNIMRALDPCPPLIGVRDTQNRVRASDIMEVNLDLVHALIKYIEDSDPHGDPSVGIPDGPLDELSDLKLALIGEVRCANCDTGCADCGGKCIMTIAQFRAYHTPRHPVFSAKKYQAIEPDAPLADWEKELLGSYNDNNQTEDPA